jgi:nicotinamidase-related amidase
LHYQNEVLHQDGLIRVGVSADDPRRVDLIKSAGALLQGARDRSWPVMHVRIAFRGDYSDCPRNTPVFRQTMALGAVRDGHWGAQFLAYLSPLANEREFVFTHTRISGFAGTALEQTLRLLGVQRLLVGGVATHSVVESTVRDAADRGFEVFVASDACSAGSPAVHKASLASMSLMAEITDVQRGFESLGS